MLINLKKRLQLKKSFLSSKVFDEFSSSSKIINKLQSKSINNNFIKQLKKNFQSSKVFDNFSKLSKIILNQIVEFKKIYIDVKFELKNNFIYNLTNKRCCLYISTLCEQKFFRITHNENQHVNCYRFY